MIYLICKSKKQTALSVDAGEVRREDELVAQVVHDLQQAEDEEVGDAFGLGARTAAEKWKRWEVDFECAR